MSQARQLEESGEHCFTLDALDSGFDRDDAVLVGNEGQIDIRRSKLGNLLQYLLLVLIVNVRVAVYQAGFLLLSRSEDLALQIGDVGVGRQSKLILLTRELVFDRDGPAYVSRGLDPAMKHSRLLQSCFELWNVIGDHAWLWTEWSECGLSVCFDCLRQFELARRVGSMLCLQYLDDLVAGNIGFDLH